MFPWVVDYRRWWVYDSIPISIKIRLTKALVWPVATCTAVKAGHSKRMKKRVLRPLRWKDCEKDSAYFVDSKENKRLGSQLSWSKEGTVRHCQSNEASILWSHHEETRELSGERNNARNNARYVRRRGRPRTAWIDNSKSWTGLSVEETIRVTEDKDKWRKYVHGVHGQPSDRGRLRNRTETWLKNSANKNKEVIQNFVHPVCPITPTFCHLRLFFHHDSNWKPQKSVGGIRRTFSTDLWKSHRSQI